MPDLRAPVVRVSDPLPALARSGPAAAGRSPLCAVASVSALSVCAAVLLALGGCGKSASQAGGGGGGMPPPTVGVVTVRPEPVNLVTELPGRLEAWRTAQVRARVSGVVQKRLFTEGGEVRSGQSLYQLEDASLRATLASAEAQRARAEAQQAQAEAQLQRNRPLVEQKAISQQEWVATETARKQADADLAAAKAAVQTAQVNLAYASVLAPISGRVGRSQVTEGALVGVADANPMVTIQQLNPLYVNFTQSASDALALERAFAAGRLKRLGTAGAEVRVVLEDGSLYPQAGKLLFADKTVDPSSGQVSLRAELPNPQGLLLPGLFVRVRLEQARSAEAVLLPQQAVTRSAAGDTVLVVGPDRKVAPRPVKVGGSQGNRWVIQGGLAAGDQVVVDGFQKLMMAPGAPVNAVPWVPGGAASAPGAAGSAAPAAAPAAASAAASR